MGGYETGSEGPRGHHAPVSHGASSAGTASPQRCSCDSPSACTGVAGPRPWRQRGGSTCPTMSVTRASACARGHAHTHVDTWLCVHKHTRIQHVYTTHTHTYHSHAHSTGIHTPTMCSCTWTHMLGRDHTRASIHPHTLTVSHMYACAQPICLCTRTHAHMCSHMHTHTCPLTRVHIIQHTHTFTHAYTLTHIHTDTCIYLHNTHPHMHTCTHSHMCGPDPPGAHSRTRWAEPLRTSGPR